MALTEYTLPSVVTYEGTFKFTLYAAADLIVPTGQTITSIGELEKVGDLEPNKKQFQNLSLTIADDYSTYEAGFWYTIALDEMYLRIYLDEGAGDTGYFYGFIDPMQSDFQEHYVGSLDFVRSGTMVLTSIEAKLFATTLGELETVVQANRLLTDYYPTDQPVHNDIFSYIKLKDMFSCLLNASGLNATYDTADTRVIYSAAVDEQDFVYTNTASPASYFVDELYLVISRYSETVVPGVWQENSGSSDIISDYQVNFGYGIACQMLMVHLLNSIQFDMELGYEGERHVINLYQRARAYAVSANVTMGSLLSSRINVCSDLRKSGYRAYNYSQGSTLFAWFSDMLDLLPHTVAVPDYINIEVDVPLALRIVGTDIFPGGLGYATEYNPIPYGMSSDEDVYVWFNKPYEAIREVKYWNYETGAYVTPAGTGLKLLEEAVAGYLFSRFHTAFRAFTRIYGSLKANNGATNVHTNNHPHMRTAFDDGTGSKQYYANRVVKNADSNITTVDWIEE